MTSHLYQPQQKKRYKTQVTCHRCGKKGHYANEFANILMPVKDTLQHQECIIHNNRIFKRSVLVRVKPIRRFNESN